MMSQVRSEDCVPVDLDFDFCLTDALEKGAGGLNQPESRGSRRRPGRLER